MPAVKISARLDLEQNAEFSDGNYLELTVPYLVK